ncbi:MAG: hypothetical protein ACI9FB_000259 [Candidatus Azotimanducaceae bacterium]|jgi:hypothetical protein
MRPVLSCWNCGHALDDLPLPISRHANCHKCYEVLHCCRFCIFYDKSEKSSCREDDAEPPNNKESANFCEYFKPNSNASQSTSSNQSAISKLDALFLDAKPDEQNSKKTQPSLKENNPLDDLFDN